MIDAVSLTSMLTATQGAASGASSQASGAATGAPASFAAVLAQSLSAGQGMFSSGVSGDDKSADPAAELLPLLVQMALAAPTAAGAAPTTAAPAAPAGTDAGIGGHPAVSGPVAGGAVFGGSR